MKGTHADTLRELLARTPQGIESWGHTRSVQFKDAIRAASRALKNPHTTGWMLESHIRTLRGFHERHERMEA